MVFYDKSHFQKKPSYDIETITRAITEPNKNGRAHTQLIENYVCEAIDRAAAHMRSPIQLLLLHAIVYGSDKFKLTPLVISNFFNYQLSPVGAIKPIKTKAWDKSREQIRQVRKRFIDELQEVGQQYYRDLR